MLVTNVHSVSRWQRTHEQLSQAAVELFTEHGYEATGTAQIAQRAGVSEMTLFRHFPTKEALLLTDPFDPAMAKAVRERPEEESPMQALTAGIGQVWHTIDDDALRTLRGRLRIIARAPALRGAIERNSETTAGALAGALQDRGVDRPQAHVAAAAVIAGLSTALQTWATTDAADLEHTLASALAVLAGE